MAEGFSALPPLNGLRVFEVVARHLNFRLAAQELGVTQAAVAQQVRGLEANLGIKLFERLPRGLGLTGAGQRYSSDIRSAFALISSATQALRPDGAQLTISVTPTFAAKWLIPRLASLAHDHPDIDLQVLATDRLSQFRPEGVDIAVRYGRPPFGPALHVEPFLKQRIVAVASPGLLAQLGKPASLDDLHRFALLHDAHNFWPTFIGEVFAQPLLAGAKNVRFNQTSLAIDAAVAGQGLALASDFFVRNDIEAGRLALVFEQQLVLERAFYLVWPRNAYQAPALERVRSWLLQQAQASGQ